MNKNILTVQFKSMSVTGIATGNINIPALNSLYIIAPSYIPSLNIGSKYYSIKVILDSTCSKDLSVIVSIIYY